MRILLISLLWLPGIALGGICKPTPPMTEGGNFKPITQKRVNIGKGFLVSGKVLSARNCRPVANAKIAHWQAGENGRYQDRLRAYLFSDKKGRYQFETEWPAAYVSHIHFRVSAQGYRTLTTQWVGNKKIGKLKFDIVLVPK